ncbi:MAG TPA: hypothetical protein VNO81_12325, partial [Candidatus Nitrosotenuis sp.]|nr:hypothetical protein [Candidatus Nitrosotenuis sp.]
EAAGIRDILTKAVGSKNPVNIVYATMKGLTEIMDAERVGRRRGKTVEEMVGKRLAETLTAPPIPAILT